MDETKCRPSRADAWEQVRRALTAIALCTVLGTSTCVATILAAAVAEAQVAPPATAPSGVTTIHPSPLPPSPTQSELPTSASPPAVSGAVPPAVTVPSTTPTAELEVAPGLAALPPIVIAPAPRAPTTVVVAPVAAPPAPVWSPLFTGSFFTRYELRAGYDDLGLSSATSRQRFLEGDAFFYRARFGIGTGLFEIGPGLKVGLQFTPQTTGTFGNLTASPNAPNTVVDASIGLHEGYARVQGKYTRLDSGRFELNYGDSLILGNLDWHEIGRSFDGVRARISRSPTAAWLDLFATLLDEGRTDFLRAATYLDQRPGIGAGDVYFLGAYGALGPAITAGLDLDVYALVRTWSETKDVRLMPANAMSPLYGRENAAEATFGVRAKQKLSVFDYRFEAGVQVGSRPGVLAAMATPPAAKVERVDVFAQHADLEIGLTIADMFRIGLEGIYASGDDPDSQGKNEGFDELYPTAHKFLGLSDAFVQAGSKRTNVASGVLHLTATVGRALTLQADGHVFSRLEKSAATFGQDGLAGGELDIAAVLLLGKGLKLRATYAIFYPKDALYKDVLPNPTVANGADPVQFAEIELRYDLMP